MSNSKSLKTDLTPEQEKMWERLKYVPPVAIDIESDSWWNQAIGRGFRQGEVVVFAAHSGTGKSFFAQRLYEKAQAAEAQED